MDKKTKIAVFAYPHYKCPPEGYGPMQEVQANIVKGLAKTGKYEIDAYATGNSSLPANIISVKETPISEDTTVPDPKIYELLSIGELINRKDEYDLISSHVGFHLLPFAKLFSCPLLINLQGDYDNKHYYNLFEKYKDDAYFITVSDSQREYLPQLNYAGTVYHGIELDKYEFNERTDRTQLGFLGRTDPVKGMGDAIQAALKTELVLSIGARKSPA
jgi:glycosyltransferase involved in cell wall biosynthesis